VFGVGAFKDGVGFAVECVNGTSCTQAVSVLVFGFWFVICLHGIFFLVVLWDSLFFFNTRLTRCVTRRRGFPQGPRRKNLAR